MALQQWWNNNRQGKTKALEEMFAPNAALRTTNPIRTAIPGKMGLPRDKPETNRLNYAMGPSRLILSCNGPPAYHVEGSTKGHAQVTKTSL